MDRVWREIGEALQLRKAGIAADFAGLKEQGQPAAPPWQGAVEFAKSVGFDLGEMSKERARETENLRTALADAEREVHQARIKELDDRLQRFVEASQTKPKEERPQTFLEKLDALLGGQLADRFLKGMLGEGQQKEERPRLSQQIDMLAEDLGEDPAELRKRLRGPTGLREQVLQGGEDTSIRLQVLKLVLDNDLQAARDKAESADRNTRTETLKSLLNTVQGNLPDFLAALRMQTSQWNSRASNPAGPSSGSAARPYACSSCGKEFSVVGASEYYFCPHCGIKLSVAQAPAPASGPEDKNGLPTESASSPH